MSQHEATVEVLTAEVRVLMVGSRQITLSVVRQLDYASPAEIKPFGRIRADRKPAAEEIEVIGSIDGVLATSSTWREKRDCRRYGQLCEPRWAEMDEATKTAYIDGRRGGHTERLRALEQKLPAHADHIWHKYTPSQAIYDTWADLPLIVLAGLR